MGGGEYAGSAPSYAQNIGQLMQQYMQYLPGVASVTSSTQPGIDMTAAKSAAATAPIYNQAAYQNYAKYAPMLAGVGQNVAQSNATAGANTANSVLSGPGAQLTRTATALENAANPEQAAVRSSTANAIQQLMGSINLNGLSGSERAEVERSLGQSQTATGNLGLDNATNAVQNAMTFGSALQTKRDALGQAISSATNFLPASRANFDPVSLALTGNPGTSSASSSAVGQFQGVTPSGNQGYTMGNNTMSGLNSTAAANMGMQYQANQANSFGGILGSQTSAIGNICCFIFLEATNGLLPWWVRKSRDRYYMNCPDIARGYKRMAKWLVPLMRHVPLVKHAVNRWMVSPLILYGGWVHRIEEYRECRMFRPYRNFWFAVWRLMGKL